MIPIAYFIHNLRMGGTERHLLQVFSNIDRSSFEPILYCLGDSHGESLHKEFEALETEVVNLRLGNFFKSEDWSSLLHTADALRRRGIRLVHGYLLEGNAVGAVLARLAGIPVSLVSKRSCFDHYSPAKLALAKISNRLASCVVANSEAVREFTLRVERCPEGKLVTIRNGVSSNGTLQVGLNPQDIRNDWGIPEGVQVVGTVARFSWKKGYENFFQAARHVVDAFPGAHFVAIGDGPLMQPMIERVKDLGIPDKVHFTGWRSDAEYLASAFDIYVCPSIIEGMSNSLLEAMARSLPVVATAVGGNVENVVEGKSVTIV
jgi:glycosyltransferase involved in cell wall biosynthesis